MPNVSNILKSRDVVFVSSFRHKEEYIYGILPAFELPRESRQQQLGSSFPIIRLHDFVLFFSPKENGTSAFDTPAKYMITL